MIDARQGFGRDELAILRRLKTPEKIQLFRDSEIGYNKEPLGGTCPSPRRFRGWPPQRMEGALFRARASNIVR